MQSNKPRASKLEADGVEAERERRPCEWLRKYADSARTGAVRSRRVSSYVGRGCSTREQENPEVRGEVSIANQSGSVNSSQSPQHPTTPISRRSSEQDHNTSRKLVNPLIELFSSPILFTAGIHFPRVLLHNQGYPKVCPDSLNLLDAGDSFAGISPLTSCYLFSQARDLIALI
jgi:hypothetical protein